MAITVVTKGGSFSTSQASTYTATITAPTTNRVQLAFILSSKNSLPDTPTSLDSTGLTWQLIADVAFAPVAPTPFRRLTAWRAQGTSSDTTVAINFPANQTSCGWSFVELNGVDITGVAGINAIADSAVAQGTGTTLALNLGGIVFTGDAVIAAFGLDTTSTITPAEGFTELHDISLGTQPNGRLQTQYHLTYDTTPTATWTSSASGGIALELKLLENAFKSNPKPGETVALTDTLTNIQLITAAEPPVVIPLRSDTVTISDTPTVEVWSTEWYGAANLIDMPQTADVVTLSDNLPIVTTSGTWQPSVEDSFTLTDTVTVRGLIVSLTASALLTVNDNPLVALSSLTALAITVNDAVTLTDGPTPNLLAEPQIADVLALTDGHTVGTIDLIHSEDVITLTDARTVTLLAQPQGGDSLTLTDTVTLKGLIVITTATETVLVSDQAQAVPGGTLPLDNFDDNAQNVALWEVSTLTVAPDPLVLVSETGHQLRITPRSVASPTLAYNGYRSLNAQNLTDTAIFVEVPQVAAVGTTADTQLVVGIDANNAYITAQEAGVLYFQDRVGGITNSSVSVPYNANTHRWWRIRHVSAGNTIRFDTSATGSPNSWTQQRSIPAALSVTAMRFSVEAGTYTLVAAPGVAIFDNLNVATLTIFPTDLLTLTESRTVTGLRIVMLVADVVTLTDAIDLPGIRSISRGDLITLTDAAEVELVAPFSDVVTVTDQAVAQLFTTGWGGTVNLLEMPHIADSVTVSHATPVVTLSAASELGPLVGDLITLTDAALLTGVILKPIVGDTLTLTDDDLLTGIILKPLSGETLTLTDATVVSGLSLPAIGADLLTLTDTRTVSLTDAPQAGDTVTLTDTVTLKGVIPSATLGDTVTLTDTATLTGLTLPIPTAESLTVTDSRTVILAVAGVLQINAPDQVTLTDTVTLTGLTLKPSAGETLTLTDTRTVHLGHAIRAADTLTLTDARTVRGLTIVLLPTDTLTITDAATWQLSTIPLVVGDQVTLTDGRTVSYVDQFISVPLIVFPVPARNFTVEAVVGVTQFVVPARDMTVEAAANPLVFTVEAREMTVEAVVGLTQFIVPSRDFTVEAAA